MQEEDQVQVSNPELFAYYAGNNVGVWLGIVGQSVMHTVFGRGAVLKVYTESRDTSDDNLRIEVRFEGLPPDKAVKVFTTQAFAEGFFTDLAIPQNLAEFESVRQRLVRQKALERQRTEEEQRKALQREEEEQRKALQREREAEAEKHFAHLRSTYLVSGYADSSPSSPLYKMLLQLDSNEPLDDRDVQWLKESHLHQLLAVHYQQEYSRSPDGWLLARASSSWRQGRYPQKALEVTQGCVSNDARCMSAILTTRGGACRDIGDLEQAEANALAALTHLGNSYHPYNLLGAIYLQRGRPEEAGDYFEKARRLGSTAKEQDSLIRIALKDAGKIEKKRVAEYLLKKDADRYRWAEYYLR